MELPPAAAPLLMEFSIAFTRPTYQRALLIATGLLLTQGRRTLSRVLWTLFGALADKARRGDLVDGHPSAYSRLFSRASWCLWTCGWVLVRAVLTLVPENQPVLCPVDETVAQHRGKPVYGKGRHFDACRSSHAHTVPVWGHCWVVVCVMVKFPWAVQPWALPVLAALYRPRELNDADGRRHKTPPHIVGALAEEARLARGWRAVLMSWFPQREFVFLGDGGRRGRSLSSRQFPVRCPCHSPWNIPNANRPGRASHELAGFCGRYGDRCCLISKAAPDLRLFDRPPPYSGKGRPRVKGRPRAQPQAVVARGGLLQQTVCWAGRDDHVVKTASASAHWYRCGAGLVPLVWVFIRDVSGTHRDEYLFCPAPGTFTTAQIIAFYTQRWRIEVTFQEVQQPLGFASPRNWCENSVLRTAPVLLGLYSLACLIFHEHHKRHTVAPTNRPGSTKTSVTFIDVLATVRSLFWKQTVFTQPPFARLFKNIKPKHQTLLLRHLTHAV